VLVGGDARRIEAEIVGVGPAADRQQQMGSDDLRSSQSVPTAEITSPPRACRQSSGLSSTALRNAMPSSVWA
jgi:hypothetical protein